MIIWVNDSDPALSGPNLNQWGAQLLGSALEPADVLAGTGITVDVDGVNGKVTISALPYIAKFETAAPWSYFVVTQDPTTLFWPSGWTPDGQPIYTGGSQTAGVRPSARDDLIFDWEGVGQSPASVDTGIGGPRKGRDRRTVIGA